MKRYHLLYVKFAPTERCGSFSSPGEALAFVKAGKASGIINRTSDPEDYATWHYDRSIQRWVETPLTETE